MPEGLLIALIILFCIGSIILLIITITAMLTEESSRYLTTYILSFIAVFSIAASLLIWEIRSLDREWQLIKRDVPPIITENKAFVYIDDRMFNINESFGINVRSEDTINIFKLEEYKMGVRKEEMVYKIEINK